MGPKFAVRENAVVKHSSNLETAETSMNTQAKRFIQAIEPLQGVWQGTSYGSWGELTEAWNTAMSGLNKALSDIKKRVGNAGALYNQYEAEQDADLKKVHGGANFDATQVRI
ncbi:WXG100 family type VII secretion target [Nakamurella lactea]|uniref:WXG100 family type VII secretion target n=1 Tax=Nakamurella lactea TaxID=459515 RepID=UPI000428BFCA|nr:WXG100 family type VII secretion target [Nakamurella lactea]